MDPLSPEQRGRLMSRVRAKDTKPEMIVRRLVHAMGFRYRLHRKDLPGTPDLAFPGRRKAIFVHGCFWHCHEGCPGHRVPKSRRDYWIQKLEGNKLRDRENRAALWEMGWDSFVAWECEAKRDPEALAARIREFLDG